MPSFSVRLPLIFLTLLAAAVLTSFYLRIQFDFNTGHMDEYDYLFVGKRLLSGETWPSYSYIFGSDFNWYLLGWGEKNLGGLSGARMVAGVFGILSLLGMYWLVYCLWQRHLTAFIAAALLSIQPIQLFISRFATYDIISFACFSLSLAPLLLACTCPGRKKYSYLFLSVVLMGLAITSKYVVILYLPVIAGLAFLVHWKIGLLFGLAVGITLLVYASVHWGALQTLYQVQIVGVHGAGNSSAEYIIETLSAYLSGLAIAWLIALLWSVRLQPKAFWRQSSFKMLFILLLLALPMIAYHLNALNMIAFYKHLVYACFFLVPGIAWFLTSFLESPNYNVLKQGLAVVGLVTISLVGYQQLKTIESAYVNLAPVIEYSNASLTATDTILSEDPYLFRYLSEATIHQSQIKESGWLDNNLDGKHESQDVIDAVWDMKFEYVFLNDQIHPELNKKLRNILGTERYKLLLDKTYENTNVMSRQVNGRISLYQRIQPPPLSLITD
jgi:hypothetical protein